MTNIITYQEAVAAGSLTYFTGKPCKKGHLVVRRTRSRKCTLCEQEYRIARYHTQDKEYYKSRYAQNKDHHQALSKQWKQDNQQYVNDQNKQYYRDNTEAVSAYHKHHYDEVLRDQQKAERVAALAEQECILFDYYSSINLEYRSGADGERHKNESVFRTYIAWKIVNELQLPVLTEYHISNGEETGRLDIFIPSLNVGIEVKLEVAYQTNVLVTRQIKKYNRILGETTFLVVSPKGSFQFTAEALLRELGSLITTSL